MTDPIRFGVLGTGRITRRMVAELQQSPEAKVTAIASRDPSRARWFADQFGIKNSFHGYQELLDSDKVDAVYVALPPSLHAQWSIAAALRGKHVLCEKPFTIESKQANEIDQACRQANVQWLDATGWLYHARTSRMREILDSGKLGDLRHISSSVSFFEPFQSDDHRLDESLGGGCLLDLGWYALGLAIWATGQAPLSVFAKAIRKRGVIYRVSAVCHFANDVSATIQCGFDIATRKWMEIAGEQASLICDDFTRPWPDRATRFWVHDRTGSVDSETIDGNQEQAMVAKLVSAIRGDYDLRSSQRLALATHLALDAARASILDQREIEL